MNERLEQIIEEHSVCMPHGEFTHDSECIEDENWFKAEARFFYNLALEDALDIVRTRKATNEHYELEDHIFEDIHVIYEISKLKK